MTRTYPYTAHGAAMRTIILEQGESRWSRILGGDATMRVQCYKKGHTYVEALAMVARAAAPVTPRGRTFHRISETAVLEYVHDDDGRLYRQNRDGTRNYLLEERRP